MTAAIAKFAAKKMLSKEMDKYKDKKVESDYDPFYEMIENPRKPGKFKKVKKQVPAYIPAHDANILAKARKTAYKLDFCLFNFMGLRFGWSSVIGLVPAVGDALDALLALILIVRMRKVECGLPLQVVFLMLLNMAIDFAVGLVPFVGDLADAAVKCNSRNVRLLEKHLDKVYKPKRLTLQEKDMAHPPPPATAYEDFSDEEDDRRRVFDDASDVVRQPTRTYSSRRDRIPDEEMGIPRRDTHRSHRSHRDRPSRQNTHNSRRH
ncbi:hypothetical protein BS50DRAFT_231965 [Corynespora cassiicola Philippines]|uniref:PH domain-containing protein n=1 Tax=Corynespora cassiicola Philippines TaxID=1448308 RepID=A0A2T2N207_CORCC|nr:hypothetical protein BS50DRAFT_231965 [Corynespora cassiicola Philippines]